MSDSVQGTWGPQAWWNPFSQDRGFTELFNTATGRDTSNPTWNNPRVYEAVGGAPNEQQKQNTTLWGGNPQPVLSNPPAQRNAGTGGEVLGTGSTPGDSRLTQLEKIGSGMNPAEREEYDRLRAQADPYAGLRNTINQGWDFYTNQLNDMLNVGLPGQRAGQEQIVQSSFTGGINQLDAQKASSTRAVESQQAKSLNDLAANVRNLFQAGNINLGARGAADSSAANQYSYAIQKMGTKAWGDILSQVNDRMNQIGDIYNTEVNRLETEKNTRMGQIADWFNQAQNQVRQSIGQAGLGRSQDLQSLSQQIYNRALTAMQQLQAESANRRASLESWAMNNSKSVSELVKNMQTVQQMPGFQGINGGMPQVMSNGQYYVPSGYGGSSTEKKDLFGNIIS